MKRLVAVVTLLLILCGSAQALTYEYRNIGDGITTVEHMSSCTVIVAMAEDDTALMVVTVDGNGDIFINYCDPTFGDDLVSLWLEDCLTMID